MEILKKRWFYFFTTIAILSIALRAWLLPLPGFSGDLNMQVEWGEKIVDTGFWGLYGGDYYPENVDYPPLFPTLVSLLVRLSRATDIATPQFLIKLTATIFDAIVVFLSLYLIRDLHHPRKHLLVGTIILSPALALISAGWGQVDSILLSVIILGYLFFFKEKYTLATLTLFTALLIKPQALIPVGLYAILLFAKSKKDFLYQGLLAGGLFATGIATFTFFGQSNFLAPFTEAMGRYTSISLNATNFWFLFFGSKIMTTSDTNTFMGVAYGSIGLFLFALAAAPTLFFAYKHHDNRSKVFFALGCLYLAFFTFLTQMHERYVIYSLPFLALATMEISRAFSTILYLNLFTIVNVGLVLITTHPANGEWLFSHLPPRTMEAMFIFAALLVGFNLYLLAPVYREFFRWVKTALKLT